MKTPRHQLIKKYVRAYLQTYGSSLHPDDAECFSRYLVLLKKTPITQFFTYQSVRTDQEKITFFMKLFSLASPASRAPLRESVEKLVTILAAHGRLALLQKILELILIRFFNTIGYQHATIATSYPLSTEEQKNIIKSFSLLTHQKIDAEFKIDHTLIAGLKIVSQDYRWESSIAQKIKALSMQNKG